MPCYAETEKGGQEFFKILEDEARSQGISSQQLLESMLEQVKQAPTSEGIYSLSLKELLEMEVSLASKTPQSISQSPGFTSSYDDTDIQRLGYYTLWELANITPGYSSYSIFGEKVLETRGQKSGSFNNNKHLLLVDGIPINHARAYKAQIEEDLPLFFAKKVEFLRGPASSLYGIGAFYGVMSIESQVPDEGESSINSLFSVGSLDNTRRLMSTALVDNEAGKSHLSIGYYSKQASREFIGIEDDENNRFEDDQRSLFLNLRHQIQEGTLAGLTFGSIYLSRETGLGEGFLNGNFTSVLNELSWITWVPYLQFRRALSDVIEIHSWLKFNYSQEKGWYAPFDKAGFDNFDGSGNLFAGYNSQVHNVGALTEIYWSIDSQQKLIAGIDIDYRQEKGAGDGYGILITADPANGPFAANDFDDSDIYRTYSLYAQYQLALPVLDGLQLTLGGRQDNGDAGDNSYSQFSPRVALIQNFAQNWFIKAQYATALRAPGIKELELNKEALLSSGAVGIPNNLEAETFISLELGLGYSSRHIVTNLVLFSNKTQHSLDGVTVNNVNFFINATEHVSAQGWEYDLRLAWMESLQPWFNASYALAEDASDNEQFDVPVHKANFGLNVISRTPINMSSNFIVRWVEGYRSGDSDLPHAEGHTVVDVNVFFEVSRQLDVQLQIKNLFDEEYKQPKNALKETPMPRRGVFASINMVF
ncbi:MAG: TonB-dependent receptor [Pseudomonadales bacterium]|nr:TonB-dependent receptor [Pseudomonadales bacterium]